MVVLLLLACSSNGGTDEALADFLTAVDAIDTLVAGHAAAVDAAGTVADVTTLESTYTTDWATQQSTLADALDMISQCAMADDDDAAMAAAVQRLLSDPKLAEQLSVNGRELSEQSSWPSVRDRWTQAFKAALGR